MRTIVLVAAVTGLAVAVPAVAAGPTPPKPAAGKWVYRPVFGETPAGGFSVSRSRASLSGLRTVVGPGSGSSCGTGTVAVRGHLRFSVARRAGYATWIVGHNAPKTSDGATALRVTIVQGGKAAKGRVKIFFQTPKTASVEIDYGSCSLSLAARKR